MKLTPLGRNYFTGGRLASVLLGPNEISRDTIPVLALCLISPIFRDHFATQEDDEFAAQTIKLPELDPGT